MDKPEKIIELEALFGSEFCHFEMNFESGLNYYSKQSPCCYSIKDNIIIAFEINFEMHYDWYEDADLVTSKYRYQRLLDDFINSISNLNTLEFIKITGSKNRLGFDINRLNIYKKLKLISLSLLDIGSNIILSEFTLLSHLAIRFCLLENIEFAKSNWPTIEYLDLSQNHLIDLTNLSKLANTKFLNLQSNNINDITPLYHLHFLYELRLDNNKITYIDSLVPNVWCSLNLFCTTNNPVENIPHEIVNDESGSMPGIRSFLCDESNSGSVRNNEVKIILLGNGNVGKSQIAHRLAGLPFNSEYDSTQKIDLFQSSLVDENGEILINANIWDFGGQDIYHVTHRIFLETRALFIIAWDHVTEFKSHHEWNGNDYENYNLKYWIEYVNYHSPGSPILVVQNKIDCLDVDGVKIIPASKSEIKEKYGFKIDFAEVCARPLDDHTINKALADDGIEILKKKILNVFNNNTDHQPDNFTYNFSDPRLEEFKRSLNTSMPRSWIEVIQEIRNRQKKNLRDITNKEFYNICTEIEQENDYKISNPDELLKFLSNAGIVYYNENYFSDTVILDQEWFIEEIYKLFDRTKEYSKQLSGIIDDTQTALLTPSLIKKIWPNKSTEEISLYLNHLITAEIILKLGEKKSNSRIDIKNDLFFIPAYLPKDTSHLENYKFIHKVNKREDIPSGFVPPVLIKKLMLNYMRNTKSIRIKDKWQNGIIIAFENQLCIVTVDYVNPKIIIEYKEDSGFLKSKIIEEIDIINNKSAVKSQGTESTIVYGLDNKTTKGLKSLENNSQETLNLDLQFKWLEIMKYFSSLESQDKIIKLTQLIYASKNSDSILEMNSVQVLIGNQDTQINALIEIINKMVNMKSKFTKQDDPKTKYAFYYRLWVDLPIYSRWFVSIILLVGLAFGGYHGYKVYISNNKLDLLGTINFNGRELEKSTIKTISIYNYPEFNSQYMKHHSNGNFVFRDFSESIKYVQFEITFENNTKEITQYFEVRKSEKDVLTVDNIWIENTEIFKKKFETISKKPKNKAIIINNHKYTIYQINEAGDNNLQIVDSTQMILNK